MLTASSVASSPFCLTFPQVHSLFHRLLFSANFINAFFPERSMLIKMCNRTSESVTSTRVADNSCVCVCVGSSRLGKGRGISLLSLVVLWRPPCLAPLVAHPRSRPAMSDALSTLWTLIVLLAIIVCCCF
ncbi:GPI-anchored surface protein, putative [Bodo saltans]|uniref:GPI-anchored surface protein, putative n=1 Tax=Bodo saltans TaxID=75058 RepID=A0A0S4J211_BODSA|nr:GPI-anchored surface protein, putative [Bodo saltans]|eukprot:CUG05614.1 GPI-anchored surface protein, putative [Bodo saltans]